VVLATNDVQGNFVEELCRVKGVFQTGSEEMDSYLVQAPIGFLRRLFRLPGESVTRLGIILKNPDEQKLVMSRIKKLAGDKPVAVLPWQTVMPDVASYIRNDRAANRIFMSILLFIVLFTIFNTILMSVLERQREFAVLLAVGTEPRLLSLQVILEAAFLGSVGCVTGVIVGYLLGSLINYLQIDLTYLIEGGFSISGFALSTTLYCRLRPLMIFLPAGLVLLATLILSLIPMRRAVRVPIVDLLR
jgi:ABC-type lipoprotein release transport system permease subunit